MAGEVTEATEQHVFYIDNVGWIPASMIEEGDKVVLQSGDKSTVEKIEKVVHNELITVYNFEVEDFHTYFVSDASVLVHNNGDNNLACGQAPSKKRRKGRTGKQKRLRQMAEDDKLSSALRGEIKRDINQIKRKKRKNIRVPKGHQMAHKRGYEARKGYGYEYSNLNTISDHKRQHKFDSNGNKR